MTCVFGDRMCDQNGKASGSTTVSQVKHFIPIVQRKSGSAASRRDSRRRLHIVELSSHGT